jgi:3-hydroxy acid dehydrogenase/malonic semialdehyde reductase
MTRALTNHQDKLSALQQKLQATSDASSKIIYRTADVGDYEAIDAAVASAVEELGKIDVLINNVSPLTIAHMPRKERYPKLTNPKNPKAGLALDAPAPFHALPIASIKTMNATNVSGYMYATHSVLNRAMKPGSAHGTILNITSTTALEAPPFPGEAVYHANKACQEGFTNSLRNELVGTDIRVLALRPGVVAGHFHRLRVGGDEKAYEGFMEGYE